jgi:hypothetical protein
MFIPKTLQNRGLLCAIGFDLSDASHALLYVFSPQSVLFSRRKPQFRNPNSLYYFTGEP